MNQICEHGRACHEVSGGTAGHPSPDPAGIPAGCLREARPELGGVLRAILPGCGSGCRTRGNGTGDLACARRGIEVGVRRAASSTAPISRCCPPFSLVHREHLHNSRVLAAAVRRRRCRHQSRRHSERAGRATFRAVRRGSRPPKVIEEMRAQRARGAGCCAMG